MKSQNAEVLNYLKTGASITPSYAAVHFRIWRLAARIYDLRELGYNIVTDTVKRKSKRTGKTVQYAAYWLEDV